MIHKSEEIPVPSEHETWLSSVTVVITVCAISIFILVAAVVVILKRKDIMRRLLLRQHTFQTSHVKLTTLRNSNSTHIPSKPMKEPSKELISRALEGGTQQENMYQNLILNTLDTPAAFNNDNQASMCISDVQISHYEELNQGIMHDNTYSTLYAGSASISTTNIVIEMAECTDESPTSDYQELSPDLKDDAECCSVSENEK